MREHEVPTHVQAEDRVLLWFTFPQVVAMTAVCALSYGAYRYAPVGPSEVRMALAVLLGLAGLVAVVGKIGGRRLPLVAADLLKYRLGARLYAGPPSELVRSEPPAPAQPVKSGPGPLRLMARRAGKTLRRLRRKRGSRERKGGRMPFRPHRWFGKPRRTDKDNINGNGNGDGSRKSRRGKPPKSFLAIAAVVALAAAVAVPQAVCPPALDFQRSIASLSPCRVSINSAPLSCRPASVGEQVTEAEGVRQVEQRHLMSQVGPYALVPPTSYGEGVGSDTACDLRPRQAGLHLEPLQALWEVVGEYVGPWAVVCVRSQHGEPVLPQDSRTLTYEIVRYVRRWATRWREARDAAASAAPV